MSKSDRAPTIERDKGSRERGYDTGAERNHSYSRDAFNIVELGAERVVRFRDLERTRSGDPEEFSALVERVWAAYNIKKIMDEAEAKEAVEDPAFLNVVAVFHKAMSNLEFNKRALLASAHFFEPMSKLFENKKTEHFIGLLKLLFGFIIAKGAKTDEIEAAFEGVKKEELAALVESRQGEVFVPVPGTDYQMILGVKPNGEKDLEIAFKRSE